MIGGPRNRATATPERPSDTGITGSGCRAPEVVSRATENIHAELGVNSRRASVRQAEELDLGSRPHGRGSSVDGQFHPVRSRTVTEHGVARHAPERRPRLHPVVERLQEAA